MAKTVKAQLKCRHDTAANWTAKNPVLLDGELGVETDTTFFKIGDGATAWTSLKYVTSKSAVYDSVGRRIDTSYLLLSGGTLTGNLTAPSFQTGSGTANYFQCRKFRGEGNADTYYHAIDFGYAGHDQVDFYEYGGTWNFWQNTASSKGGTLVGSIRPDGFHGDVIGDLTGTASKATADANGNNIAGTYATKDYVAQAIKEALAAATITYDGKVTYKG